VGIELTPGLGTRSNPDMSNNRFWYGALLGCSAGVIVVGLKWLSRYGLGPPSSLDMILGVGEVLTFGAFIGYLAGSGSIRLPIITSGWTWRLAIPVAVLGMAARAARLPKERLTSVAFVRDALAIVGLSIATAYLFVCIASFMSNREGKNTLSR
jgi:hypothetical protein